MQHQIEEDWNFIINRICEGKVHEFSEDGTAYLGACANGNTHKKMQ